MSDMKPSQIDLNSLERLTMEDWGTDVLYDLYQKGYYIWVSPVRTMKVERNTCSPDCDGGVCCGGRATGRQTLFPNRKGYIESFDVPKDGRSYPPQVEIDFYTGDKVAFTLQEIREETFDDFNVIAIVPGESLMCRRYEILRDMIEAAKAKDAMSLGVLNRQFEDTFPDIDVLKRTLEETEYDNCRQSCLLTTTIFVNDPEKAMAHAEKSFARFATPWTEDDE